ncbi:MAG TPA: 2Fe-2S iron-sulfur cluster-binding protein [Chlorobaculum sp.]|nr:(2Fe-2S)-binding protein [Chlorobiales bacterium]HWR00633.1 2Fe-2S iron-sulfur cluster-binding protein [Chlorobaculum sp.]
MNLIINDKPAESLIGQTIGKAARLNHSHVGYVCGGHGLCQACYVTVQEGAENLASLTEVEKAFLSPRQIAGGGRLACQATIAKEGTVKVLSRPEEVRRLLFSNPRGLFSYGARLGQDTAQQIGPGIINLAGRIQRGEMGGKEAFADLKESLEGAVRLAIESVPQSLPFRDQILGLAGSFPVRLPFLPSKASSQPVVLERVNITVQPQSKA